MLATAVLFVEPDLPRRMLGSSVASLGRPPARRPAAIVFVAAYLAVQVLLPLRHWLHPDPVGWTEEAQHFGWLMKLRSKSGHVVFQVRDGDTGPAVAADPAEELNPEQIRRMTFTPEMIQQYARHLRDVFAARGMAEPQVRAETWVSLNRRPPQRLVDPAVDLAALPRSGAAERSWIVALAEQSRPGTLSLADYAALLETNPGDRRAE
jgi:hypothetical protein